MTTLYPYLRCNATCTNKVDLYFFKLPAVGLRLIYSLEQSRDYLMIIWRHLLSSMKYARSSC